MDAKIINGKNIAEKLKEELAGSVKELKKKGMTPGLAVIIVGEDPASQIYVRNKQRAAEAVGIYSEVHTLAKDTTEEDLTGLVQRLNDDGKIHGILVQLPLPKHINEHSVIERIDPRKDVDCFHQENVGKLMIGNEGFLPCTPSAVVELLDRSGVKISGRNVTIVGRSNIVGKPLSIMMLGKDATVTVAHSKTRDLKDACLSADILISAAGRPGLIKKDMIKSNAVVIDVGINRLPDGKIVGDVDFAEVSQVAGAITPVPGGVGPMTIAMLLRNTVEAAKNLRTYESS